MKLLATFTLALSFYAHAAAAQFAFAALGDTPYTRDEEPQFVSMIAEMNRQPLAFVLHVGDFKDARSECSDALYLQRREWFQLSHHPFFYTPGDNEWTDCGRAYWARRAPLERLGKLREIFFARDSSLGQRTLRAERQHDRGHPEHMRWRIDNIVFATLNIPGPDNNRARMADESRQRTAALIDWMRDTFRIARSRALPGIVLATQANIWSGSSAYARILETLAAEAQRYPGEVLVIHGDTHWFRLDRPLLDPATGRAIENVTRLEVYGSPFVDWVHVTVGAEGGKVRFEVVPGSRIALKERP
jgi:hypothetical protein